MARVVIGAGADTVTITVLRRLHPKATDFDDGNWVWAKVEVRIRPWSGAYDADLRTEEFVRFREGLEQMHRTLSGTAEFDPLEPWLWLKLEIDPLGRITFHGKAAPESDGRLFGRVGLHFQLDEAFDQTFLPPLIDQLRALEEEFPVVGR